MSLPTYQEVISSNADPEHLIAFQLVASWVDGSSLASLCRTSRSFYLILNPLLWSNPVKVLAQKHAPFTQTDLFLNRFSNLRKSTQQLVTTLDLQPLLSLTNIKQYDWAQNEWKFTGQRFFSIFNEYVNLRFAILDGLEGFQGSFWSTDIDDQSSLRAYNELALAAASRDERYVVETATGPADAKSAHFLSLPEPILLSVEGCRDLDCLNALTCPSMNNLLYLDISYTSRTESWLAFSALNLNSLRILKVRGLGLTDNHLSQILSATSDSLWSLDARENLLTDTTIWAILHRSLPKLPAPAKDALLYESTPLYQRDQEQSPSVSALPSLRYDSKSGMMNYIARYGQVQIPHRQVLDDNDPLLQSTGLTHMYLSGNKFTSDGIRRLLSRTNRLQVFDAGSVVSSVSRSLPSGLIQLGQPDTAELLDLITGTRLEKLRLHHSVVTGSPTLAAIGGTAFSISYIKLSESMGGDPFVKFDLLSNCRLQELTLTGIPTKSSGFILNRLIQLLRNCKAQAKILREQSGKWSSYRRAPPMLRGLQTLRFEFLAPDTVSGPADPFLAESQEDFSFFSESKPSPKAGADGTIIELLDIPDELKKFRESHKDKWKGKLELVFPYGR